MNTLERTSQTEKQGNGEAFDLQHLASAARTHDKSADAVEHSEGKIARMIEEQTAKLPSDTFLWAAVGAIGASAVCEMTGLKDKSRFFGQWVAPLLLLGVYNKLVKVHGSDQIH